MKITGIICEYNPFHKGHKLQIDMIKENILLFDRKASIKCLSPFNSDAF